MQLKNGRLDEVDGEGSGSALNLGRPALHVF